MLRRAALAGALIASISCNRSGGGEGAGSAPVASAGSARPSPAGSFSTDLAKELAGPAKGAPPPGAAPGSGSAAAESRSGSAAGEPRAGDPAAGGAAKPGADTGSGDKTAGDKPGETAGGKAGDKPGAGAQRATPAAPGEARPASAGSTPADKPGTAASGSQPAAEPPVLDAPARGPVKVPAELAAIKLSLLPNWDRDLGQAGTFQYVVRIKGTQSTKTFTFHYGYDDPRAPRDHEQYKKYLQDTRALTGEIRDRQRGAAWFLEGNDAAGMPAFRYVVLYGGKQLICYGSLYKDADSSRLGDDRDQTLIQAKQICETLAL